MNQTITLGYPMVQVVLLINLANISYFSDLQSHYKVHKVNVTLSMNPKYLTCSIYRYTLINKNLNMVEYYITDVSMIIYHRC